MALEEMGAFFNRRADIYDAHMLQDLELDAFYREITDCVQPTGKDFSLLDIGCGTGIELEGLFAKYPGMRVTGVDLSAGMLQKLKEKFPKKEIELICGSYFDLTFASDYDVVLSTYSLHHWNASQKLSLYQKVFKALKNGGVFINGDYTCKTPERERYFQDELARLRKQEHLQDNVLYHYDIPLTANTEQTLLHAAGFQKVCLVREWENTSILTARKCL